MLTLPSGPRDSSMWEFTEPQPTNIPILEPQKFTIRECQYEWLLSFAERYARNDDPTKGRATDDKLQFVHLQYLDKARSAITESFGGTKQDREEIIHYWADYWTFKRFCNLVLLV